MKWRDILIGALVTLAITIAGGVAVYYLTRQEPPKPKAEDLRYEVGKPVNYKTAKTELTLYSFKLGNSGDAPAKNVAIAVRFPPLGRISDYKVELSSEPIAKYQVKRSESNLLEIFIPVLTPTESLSLSVLLSAAVSGKPEIAVKSESSVGREQQLVTYVVRERFVDNFIRYVVPIAAVLQILLFVLLRRYRHQLVGYPESLNNTAFLYLHQGMVEEARKLLEAHITKEGGTAYELSNYGLCLAVLGEKERAIKILAAAKFLSRPGRKKALFDFSNALAGFYVGDPKESLQNLEEVISKYKNTLLEYVEFSSLVSDLRKSHANLDTTIKKLSEKS